MTAPPHGANRRGTRDGRGAGKPLALFVLLALWVFPAAGQAAGVAPTLETAADLRFSGDWDKAAEILKALREAEGDGASGRTSLAYGQICLLNGDLAAAEPALRRASASSGGLSPYGKLLLADCLVRKGQPAEAEALLRSLLAVKGEEGLQRKALWLLAGASRAAGHPEAEADAYRAYLAASPERGRDETARYRAACALEAAGRAREAFLAFSDIYHRRVGSPFVREAGLAMRRLGTAKGYPVPRPPAPEALAFAEKLLRNGHAQDALDAVQGCEPETLKGSLALEAALLKVDCLYTLRQNGRAVAEADRLLAEKGPLPQVLPACLKAGWCLVRTQDHDGVLKRAQTVLAAAPEDTGLRSEAFALMGASAYAIGRFAEAEENFRQVLSSGGGEERRASAGYKRAWCLYALKDYAGARSAFRAVAAAFRDEAYGPPSLYWSARCALNMGDLASGSSDLRALASRPPGYWSAAARAFLEGRGEKLPSSGGASPPPPTWGPALRGADADLAKALDLCGLPDEAASAFEPVYRRMRRDPSAAFTMATLYARAGLAGKAEWVLHRHFAGSLDRWNTPEVFLRALYPAPDLGFFRRAASKEAVSATLVLAIVHQESDFDEAALSPVGAVGLMQLMPDTAASAASELGLQPPSGDDLLDPAVNVRLGAHYLSAKTGEFPVAAAVASYNAGEEVVRAWIAAFATGESEQFAAMIPYLETRRYTARVLWDESVYRRLYGEVIK